MTKALRRTLKSPIELTEKLTELFPNFRAELEAEVVETYHTVVRLVALVITTYLEDDPSKIKPFCNLVNAMVTAGGDQENAIDTCLLEHASQLKMRKLLQPHPSAAANELLR